MTDKRESGTPRTDALVRLAPGRWPNTEARNLFHALVESHATIERELIEARRDAEAKQAKIDWLMLEYCPDEMTPEQLENWGKHQRPVSKEVAAAPPAAMEEEQ